MVDRIQGTPQRSIVSNPLQDAIHGLEVLGSIQGASTEEHRDNSLPDTIYGHEMVDRIQGDSTEDHSVKSLHDSILRLLPTLAFSELSKQMFPLPMCSCQFYAVAHACQPSSWQEIDRGLL